MSLELAGINPELTIYNKIVSLSTYGRNLKLLIYAYNKKKIVKKFQFFKCAFKAT